MERLVLCAVFLASTAWLGCEVEPSEEPRDGGIDGSGATGGAGGTDGSGGTAGMPMPCAMPEGDFTIIEDSEFANANWEVFESHGDGATVSIDPTMQLVSGGIDDSSYRSMTHEIRNPAVGEHENCTAADACRYGIVVTHRYLPETYTPSSDGALAYIDYSENRIITEPAFVGAAVGWAFAIWQAGTRYLHVGDTSTTFTDTAWSAENLCGLTAEDFSPDGLNLVDGGEMVFGYIRSNTNTTPASTQRNVHGIDDFHVVLVNQ